MYQADNIYNLLSLYFFGLIILVGYNSAKYTAFFIYNLSYFQNKFNFKNKNFLEKVLEIFY